MTAARHTPGPWTINRTNADFVGIAQEGYMPHATVFPRDNGPWEDTAEANARIIAAAPDLLEACRWAMRYCQEAKANQYDDRAAVPLACAISALHAAIAKAEGAATP